jgi:hypothetical protein
LSRDRRIITRKRNKLTIVAAAGALSVATATAASAAAAAWPSGLPAGDAGSAFAVVGQPVGQPAGHQTSPREANLAVAHFRSAAGHQAMLTALARQQARKAPQAPPKAQQTAPTTQQQAQQAQRTQQPQRPQQAAPKNAAVPATQPAASPANPSTPSASPSATPVPAASGSPQSIAQAMLKSFGWSSSQFSCLEPLWAHESGWSVSASNPSTGAYGIPQAMPGSKMASAGPDWQTNASTQIKWGLGYIKDTYGSPCAAESHEQADGWY